MTRGSRPHRETGGSPFWGSCRARTGNRSPGGAKPSPFRGNPRRHRGNRRPIGGIVPELSCASPRESPIRPETWGGRTPALGPVLPRVHRLAKNPAVSRGAGRLLRTAHSKPPLGPAALRRVGGSAPKRLSEACKTKDSVHNIPLRLERQGWSGPLFDIRRTRGREAAGLCTVSASGTSSL